MCFFLTSTFIELIRRWPEYIPGWGASLRNYWEFSVSNKRGTVIFVPARSQFALLFVALFLSPLAKGQDASLEIKLAKPLSWRDHRLEIAIKRVNRSKYRILLEGVEIYSSVIQAKSTLELGGRETWILVYGWSDTYSEEKTLAPGAQTHDTYYIDESFPVKDMVTNKTRQVRLQGRLRILAVFFGRWGTGKATLEVQIPCPTDAANTDCLSPPPIFAGEHDQWTVMPEAPIL
jgi:hypothetical protein